jgi:hypothetical protein
MTTVGSGGMRHRGFLPEESPLGAECASCGAKRCASSITMQTVNNVLLYRDKRLARKQQELFLSRAVRPHHGRATAPARGRPPGSRPRTRRTAPPERRSRRG